MTSNDVAMASNAADSEALETQRQAIAELTGRLTAVEAAALRDGSEARSAAAAFGSGALTPWLDAAAHGLFVGAATVDRTRLLTDGLQGEARMIRGLVTRLGSPADATRTAADVSALRVLTEAFFGKVTDILLPALAEDSSVSLTTLAADLPIGFAAPEPQGSCGCSCGEHDVDEPELDVREIPHAIRHATVFGAFDAVAPGDSMILVAHHDPIPLLHQLADRSGGRIQVEYLERGPEAWRLRLLRP